MVFDAIFFAIAIPAVVFAGVSKGGFGSGAAFAATPILALILPPTMAVGIMLPLLLVMDVAALRAYWGKWSVREVRVLLLGGVPGIVLGGAFWSIANPDILRLLIGLVAVSFVAFQLAKGRGWIGERSTPSGSVAGLTAGVAAGFTSFISHAGGPAVAVYLLSKGLSKTQYQATTVLVFWVLNATKTVPYAFLGMFAGPSLKALLFLWPAALLGVWLGVRAHRAIPERVYFGITYVLLSATGCKLIFDALT